MLKKGEKNNINYVCDCQSDSILARKTIFEYYNTSTSQSTCFSSSVWRSLFWVCLFELVIIWKGSCMIPRLISQLHGFTWQFPLARRSSAGAQGERETWRSYLRVASGYVEPWGLTGESGVPEMKSNAENSW